MPYPVPKRRRQRVADAAAIVTLAVLLAACASTQVSSAPSQPVNLSGTWTLNEDLSEDPAAILSSAASSSRSGARSGRRGGGGGPGAGRGGGGGRSGPPGGGRRGSGGAAGGSRRGPVAEIIDDVTPAEDTLTIEQSEDKLRMKYGERDSAYHGFDTSRFVQLAGQDAERLSGWQDRDFIVETSNEDGLTVTERFAVSEDGQRLTQTVEIEADRIPAPVSITRVFDRSP